MAEESSFRRNPPSHPGFRDLGCPRIWSSFIVSSCGVARSRVDRDKKEFWAVFLFGVLLFFLLLLPPQRRIGLDWIGPIASDSGGDKREAERAKEFSAHWSITHGFLEVTS